MKTLADLSRSAIARFGARLVLVPLILSFGCSRSAAWSAVNAVNEIPPAEQSDMPSCECCLIRDAPANISYKAVLFPERTNVERVLIRGIIFESDGKTPAKNTIMYFYHTDETGRYSKRGDEPRNSFAWWHGKQRGWLKTNERGEYEINTIKPAPYPQNDAPAHIHAIIRSPVQKHCYSISDFVFRDDKLLTAKFWEHTEKWWRSMGIYQDPNYGGINLTKNTAEIWEGTRDIISFPEIDMPKIPSGCDILAESPAFEPQHAWGPDKGSHACPMCKYGYQPGVLFWVNSDANFAEVEKWAKWLEELSVELGDANFKGYLIYTNPKRLRRAQLEAKLAALGQKLNLKKIAVTYVPSADDRATDTYLNRINPATENTFIVYNNRKVADKFVNFKFNEQNIALLRASVKRAGNEKELYAHQY
jgi:protocatechuate 3,4-dioxygenase beta subunit